MAYKLKLKSSGKDYNVKEKDMWLIDYLAKMDNLSREEFLKDRRKGLKARDNLRIFYVAQYQAQQKSYYTKLKKAGL